MTGISKVAGLMAVVVTMAVMAGCARKGRVSNAYPEAFYAIPKAIANERLDHNPTFIIYGDNRPGWRAKEVLAAKDTWLTWKQLYLVVYQLYLVGTGVVGTVNYVTWHPDYGGKEARMVRDAIYAAAGQEHIDMILNTGDITTDGRRPNDWKRFIEQNKEEVPLVLDYPYLPVSGNHDSTSDSTFGVPNYGDVFQYPLFYTFECPDVEFFILDSNYVIDQYGRFDDDTQDALFEEWFVSNDAQNPSWLERKLAASDKKFKIVALHHPPIAFSEYHYDWYSEKNGRDLPAKRQKLIELFQRERVQLVFSGHQHNYERSRIAYTDDGDNKHAVNFVITGGGGSPLRHGAGDAMVAEYVLNYAKDGFTTELAVQEITYNYCVVDVMKDRITVKAIAVSKTHEKNGNTIDEFVVTASGESP